MSDFPKDVWLAIPEELRGETTDWEFSPYEEYWVRKYKGSHCGCVLYSESVLWSLCIRHCLPPEIDGVPVHIGQTTRTGLYQIVTDFTEDDEATNSYWEYSSDSVGWFAESTYHGGLGNISDIDGVPLENW